MTRSLGKTLKRSASFSSRKAEKREKLAVVLMI
jgi:hypothetical protein